MSAIKQTGFKAITAQNTFSDWAFLSSGNFNLSISCIGTPSATVTVQKTEAVVAGSATTTVRDVEEFTAPIEKVGTSGANEYWRVGVKTGAYTTGAWTVGIYQD